MSDISLSNISTVEGIYNFIPTTITTLAVLTQRVGDITVIKEPDKAVWTDGILTYTVTVTNNAEHDFTSLTFKDWLDTLKIDLVKDSVAVNGVSATYTYAGGLLSVPIDDIATGDPAVLITFQVMKKQ